MIAIDFFSFICNKLNSSYFLKEKVKGNVLDLVAQIWDKYMAQRDKKKY